MNAKQIEIGMHYGVRHHPSTRVIRTFIKVETLTDGPRHREVYGTVYRGAVDGSINLPIDLTEVGKGWFTPRQLVGYAVAAKSLRDAWAAEVRAEAEINVELDTQKDIEGRYVPLATRSLDFTVTVDVDRDAEDTVVVKDITATIKHLTVPQAQALAAFLSAIS